MPIKVIVSNSDELFRIAEQTLASMAGRSPTSAAQAKLIVLRRRRHIVQPRGSDAVASTDRRRRV
jgi:hypothetical protein